MNVFLSRFELLVGIEALEKIQNTRVIVFGLGGVGGSVCDMLVRSGISYLTIVDFDKVDESNINRQIVACSSTIGKYKTDVLEQLLLDINPHCYVTKITQKYDLTTVKNFDFSQFDVIIDCIDDVKNKKLLIKNAKKSKAYILSSMGAGNRYGIPQFELSDIHKTSEDGLAKAIRKFCVLEKIKKLDVVYTKQVPVKNLEKVGSVVYYTTNMATIIAANIINKIIKGEIKNGDTK